LLAARPELRVVFSGVEDEAPLIESIRRVLPDSLRTRAHSGVGLVDIPTLIGLLDRSDACVSNDTGAMHLARACGTPVVALLGAEDDRRWGPYPLGPAPAVAFRYRVPCSPCVRWTCGPLFCLRSISVDEVMDALSRLLDAGRERRLTRLGATPAIPLERHVVTRSWEALSGAFELPLARVAVIGDAAHPPSNGDGPGGTRLNGRDAAARYVQSSGALNRTIASIARQSYPRIETIVGESCLGATDDGIVVPVRPGVELGRDALADYVARAVRDTSADDRRAVQ
jgi:hypothetical protein